MPRIRSIKPEYFSHPVLGDCAPLTRLAFIGLWCFADRGRVKDDPRRLKVLILPFDELDFDDALSELERQGLIPAIRLTANDYSRMSTNRHE